MTVQLRAYRPDDDAFLRRMHYEAVYWGPGRPSFAEAAARPGFFWQIEGWGERAGDTALLAWAGEVPVGAAWYRFWPVAAEAPAGFIDTATPVLGIAVHEDWRRRGIGRQLLEGLIAAATAQGLAGLSLNVSKGNGARNLYEEMGFVVHEDRGEALTMSYSSSSL
ncbi:MAG: GNAT family N-acetyltransferase [Ardenticatenales bacterium]|nr:GNAT family N-acetyltransferase [Ardenticatenales bacterium]